MNESPTIISSFSFVSLRLRFGIFLLDDVGFKFSSCEHSILCNYANLKNNIVYFYLPIGNGLVLTCLTHVSPQKKKMK